jgi:hypothetical protein
MLQQQIISVDWIRAVAVVIGKGQLYISVCDNCQCNNCHCDNYPCVTVHWFYQFDKHLRCIMPTNKWTNNFAAASGIKYLKSSDCDDSAYFAICCAFERKSNPC